MQSSKSSYVVSTDAKFIDLLIISIIFFVCDAIWVNLLLWNRYSDILYKT